MQRIFTGMVVIGVLAIGTVEVLAAGKVIVGSAETIGKDALEFEPSWSLASFEREFDNANSSNKLGGRTVENEFGLRLTYGALPFLDLETTLGVSSFDTDDPSVPATDQSETDLSGVTFGALFQFMAQEAAEDNLPPLGSGPVSLALSTGIELPVSDTDAYTLGSVGLVLTRTVSDDVSVDIELGYSKAYGKNHQDLDNGVSIHGGVDYQFAEAMYAVLELNWDWEETSRDETTWTLAVTPGVSLDLGEDKETPTSSFIIGMPVPVTGKNSPSGVMGTMAWIFYF